MSQTQAAECVGKQQRNAGRFLESKVIKALRGEGYTPDTIEVDSADQVRGQARFNALPLDVVSAYWLWEAFKGNQQAIGLCYALMTETLERRFDAVFGVECSEGDAGGPRPAGSGPYPCYRHHRADGRGPQRGEAVQIPGAIARVARALGEAPGSMRLPSATGSPCWEKPTGGGVSPGPARRN